MSYCNSYGTNGLSGTAVDDYKLKLKRCRETMSCTSGRCMSYNYNNNKCTCVPCDIDINATSGPTRGGYAGIIPTRGVSGLGETAAQERARHKKNIAKCDASCASNPIAAICRAEGRTVKADHCDIDTGINEYGCSCGKPIVTGSGVMTTSSNRSYGGYGNIIRSQGVGNPVNTDDYIDGSHSSIHWAWKRDKSTLSPTMSLANQANTWCQQNYNCGDGNSRYIKAVNIKEPRFMTTADCSCGGVSGMQGLNESFLESLGSLGNLAIIGLAIYGGFCLAKKL